MKLHFAPLRIKGYVHNYRENLEVVQNSSEIIERGIDISIISQISFWNALIITEDLNEEKTILNKRITNIKVVRRNCTLLLCIKK
jgi:predicted nucleic acid-binding protein